MIRVLVLDSTVSSRCLQEALSLIKKKLILLIFFKAYWSEDWWLHHIFRGLLRTACLKCVDAVPAGRGVGWVQAPALGGDARSNVA